jgi:hypothetical protein
MSFLTQLSFLLLLASTQSLTGQSSFDLVPNFGSRAQAWSSIPNDDNLFVVGDVVDTIINSNNKLYTWISELTYDGAMERINIIGDSQDIDPFLIVPNDPISDSNKTLLLYGSKRFNNLYRPTLIAIESTSGSILNSIFITYSKDSLQGLTAQLFDKNDNIVAIASSFYKNHRFNFYISLFNDALEYLNSFTISDSLYNNIVYYLKVQSDSTIVMIGDSRLISDESNFPNVKPFFMRISLSGEVIEFKRADYLEDKTINFPVAFTHTVTNDKNNNWVISCVISIETHACQNCHYLLPVTMSFNSSFDSLLWYTKFPSLAPNFYDQPLVTSIEECFDSSGFITAGFDGYSFIYKVNNQGDSLWLKKFIPLGWEEDRVAWTEFVDIKRTPLNTYVIVGRVADRVLNKIRPWILHIDSDGCLIPNCDTILSSNDAENNSSELFSLFPNPATNELYIQSHITISSRLNILISNIEGHIIKRASIISSGEEHYVLFMDEIPRGVYILSITDQESQILFSNKIVKQ